MIALLQASVPGKHRHPFSQPRIWSHYAASISHRAKIFTGIKRKGRRYPKRANHPTFVTGKVSLSTILDDPQAMLPGDCHDGIHVCRLPVQMDWDDANSP